MPSYKYTPEQQPSMWNRDTALGMAIVAAGVLTGPPGIVGLAVGGAIGGYFGKKRMEREQQNGKVANEPSYWNKDALIGTLLLPVVGTAIGAWVGKRRQTREYEYAKAHGVEVDPKTLEPIAPKQAQPVGRSNQRTQEHSTGLAQDQNVGVEYRADFAERENARRAQPKTQQVAVG